jgi:uncharacterized membrane protein YfcA
MPDTWSMLGLVLAGAALAGLVQGLSGFAFSLVAMGVWAWALPPQVAAPLAVFGALLGQLVSFASVRTGFEFRRIAPLVVGGIVGVPIGVFLLHNADPLRFKLAIGVFLTVYGLYGLLTSAPRTIVWGGRGADAFAGLLGGVLGGLAGMSGTVPAIWTQLRGWKRDLRRATMQVYNTAMHVTTLTVYSRTGTLDATTLHLFVLVAPAMLIPSYFGTRLYGRFSEQMFSRVVFALLLASGAALLANAAPLALSGHTWWKVGVE